MSLYEFRMPTLADKLRGQAEEKPEVVSPKKVKKVETKKVKKGRRLSK